MSKMAKKKATTPVVNGDNHIEDITHELVTQSADNSVTPEVWTPEKQVKLEIAKFNLADSGIEKLKKDYGELVISGPDDKTGYKAVREAWQEVRSKRTGLEKKGLEIRNGFKVITTAVSKEEDRLIELITPLEDDLYKKWKAIDEEKDRLKKEAEEEEKRQLMARVEEVMALGMTFKDGFYVCGETISMDVATLRALPAEQYDKLKKAVEAKAAEIAKSEADAAAERQRQADELKKQQDELKRQQDELKKQQEEMERQKTELRQQQEAAAKIKLENRINRFIGLGMTRGANSLNFDNGFLSFSTLIEDIRTQPDETFETFFNDHLDGISDRNMKQAEHDLEKKQEAEALELKKKNISEVMSTAGLQFQYTSQSFIFENDIIALELGWNDLVPMTEEELLLKQNAVHEQINAARVQSKKKADDLKAAEEKEKKAGMKDAELFNVAIVQLETDILKIVPGEFKTKAYQNKSTRLIKAIGDILMDAKKV